MQVSIETTIGLERRMTVGIPAEQVENEVTKRLQQAAKTVRINGFRKGKVPMKVVEQRFGAGVRQEVVGEVISRSFYEALQKESIKPAGQPSIEPKELMAGKNLEYVAVFEVYPEIQLADTTQFEIEKLVADVEESDLDTMIETLRKQQATWNVVERSAQNGDQVNIDFTGRKNGDEFAGGKGEAHKLILGSGSMIPGFEDGIVGMSAGEEKVLALSFPEDYHSEELKGAAVEFTIKVNSVSEQELPELNAEFFAKFGVDDADVEKFRAEVRKNMERELKNAAKSKLKTQVMDKLVAAHQIDLPKALISSEIDALRGQMMQQFGGAAAPQLDLKALLPDEMFKEQAERRVSLGLIVGELIKSASLKVDSDKVREMVEDMASSYQDPEEVVKYYFSNPQLLNSVEAVVLEDQVVEHILASSSVKEIKSSYEDVVKPQNRAG